MFKIIISDSSCLIALDRIGKLNILQKTFNTILTTKEVQEEFGKTLPEWIIVTKVIDKEKSKELENIVDKGEASAISLALETPESVLIIDEKKGRKLAKSLNLEIIGTLKVLLISKEKGILHSIKPIISELNSKDFRFTKSLIDEVLKSANE